MKSAYQDIYQAFMEEEARKQRVQANIAALVATVIILGVVVLALAVVGGLVYFLAPV